MPVKTLEAPWATPSMIPNAATGAPSTCVMKAGSNGYIISVLMSANRLTSPIMIALRPRPGVVCRRRMMGTATARSLPLGRPRALGVPRALAVHRRDRPVHSAGTDAVRLLWLLNAAGAALRIAESQPWDKVPGAGGLDLNIMHSRPGDQHVCRVPQVYLGQLLRGCELNIVVSIFLGSSI